MSQTNSKMQSRHFSSRYERYKADTDLVARSLVKLSAQYGFFRKSEQKPGTRGSGSSQSLADRNRNNHTDRKILIPRGYVLAVKEFLPMAQHIAKTERSITYLPEEFFSCLDRAITLRRRASDSYRKVASNDRASKVKVEDQAHFHFIQVLQDVRRVLQEQRSFFRPDMQNECYLIGEQQADIETTGECSSERLDFKLEVDSELEEKLVKIVCLVDDFQEFRCYIQQLWTQYKEGSIDLVCVSLATNSALKLAQRLEREHQDLFKSEGLEKLLSTMCTAQAFALEQNVSDPDSNSNQGDEMGGIYANAFGPVWTMLKSYLVASNKGNQPLYKPNFFGDPATMEDFKTLPPTQRLHADKMILLEIFPYFDILARSGPSRPQDDEITCGLHASFKDRTIPLWLTFALHVFLDVHHILGNQIQRGFLELQTTAEGIYKSIQDILAFQQTNPVLNWLPAANDKLKSFRDEVHRVHTVDTVHDFVQLNDPNYTFQIKSHHLLSSHPLQCGLEIYAMKAIYHDMSIAFINATGAVFSSAHLYRALQCENLLQSQWADMELFLQMQDHGKLFAEETIPRDGGYLQKFCTALALAEGQFSSLEVSDVVDPQRAPAYRVPHLARVTRLFIPRYCRGDNGQIVSGIEASLSNCEGPNVNNDDPPNSVCGSDVNIRQLLNNLCECILAEHCEFSFNYFKFHQECWMVLKMVRMGIDEVSYPVLRQGDCLKGSELPFVIVPILECLGGPGQFYHPEANHTSRIHNRKSINSMLHAIAAKLEAVLAFEITGQGYQFGHSVAQELSSTNNPSRPNI